MGEEKSSFRLFKWYFIILILILIIALVFKSYANITFPLLGLYVIAGVLCFIISQLIDAIRTALKDDTDTTKYILWAIVILAFPFFGALFYWFMKE